MAVASSSAAAQATPCAIANAHSLIKKHVHETPLLTSRNLDALVSTASSPDSSAPRLRLFFKCENFQRIGAFKARGAFHAVLQLIASHGEDEIRRKGVITHSSGNHAQALALAASSLHIPAYIVMPSNAAPSKVAGTRSHTEHVILCEPNIHSREATAASVMKETGAIMVPPYNDLNVLLGQGTCALELQGQYSHHVHSKPAPDLVISPLGGGGLLSGIATYFSGMPHVRVFGAEPSFQGGDDGKRGLEADPPARIQHVQTTTIADGLRTPLGPIPWEIFTSGNESKAKLLEGIRSVSEDQIKSAMRLVMERLKVFVEPSACVGLAALLYDEDLRSWISSQQADGEVWDVAVVLTGGNTTLEAITELFKTS